MHNTKTDSNKAAPFSVFFLRAREFQFFQLNMKIFSLRADLTTGQPVTLDRRFFSHFCLFC